MLILGRKIMNLFTKVAYSSLIFCILRVNLAFSRCAKEPKSLEILDEILDESKRSHSLFSYGCHQSLNERLQCETNKKKCSSIDNPLLQNLWYLLHDLENERECTFDEVEWSGIKDDIMVAQGERVTKEDQPDVFIIPNFLTEEQCERLVKVHKEISNTIPRKKFWRFSTTKQLLEAIFKASLSPDEYNISMNVIENCDGGTLDGMNISQKLTKVLNISSSVLVPRGENDDVDVLERNIQDMIKLPRTNAYHTQLVKYEAKSEYKAHTDCHHISNDRMATIIIYLTDVDEGGETVFPFLNISIKPQRGMAVVWRNLDDDGKCDESTTHVAGQVKKGEKYIYQKWFYQKPILPQYQDDALVYCDLSQSCREYIYNDSTTRAVKIMKKYGEVIEYTNGLEYCEQALQQQPLHAVSLILYADVLHNLGHSREALPHILSALKMHPRNKDAMEILESIVENL